ncbi:MAG: hypothetical protein IKQ64_04610 [Bacteroidales bacterium]|nr:hypothetical protein [Bacteroidales bacterium]
MCKESLYNALHFISPHTAICGETRTGNDGIGQDIQQYWRKKRRKGMNGKREREVRGRKRREGDGGESWQRIEESCQEKERANKGWWRAARGRWREQPGN